MNYYIYRNAKRVVVFECHAIDIIHADKMAEYYAKIKPEKYLVEIQFKEIRI